MGFFISERFSKILIFLGSLILIFALVLFCYKAVLFNTNVPIKTDVFGQFGDVIGGVVGSLWALAGVILFYLGLMEQRKDIKTNQNALDKQIQALENQNKEIELQRQEYEMARNIFAEQRDVLKEQSKTSRIQQFDSTFYSLLDVYMKIRNDIFFSEDKIIDLINTEMCAIDYSSLLVRDKIKKTNEKYQEVYISNKSTISHYLKTIYRLYKIIDEQSELTEKSKYSYSKIIRSQFTENELYLIYYNAHSLYGVNFRPLILKYNILKHLFIISKAEMNCFVINDSKVIARRVAFINWLDEFLIKSQALINNIEVEDPNSSALYTDDNTDILVLKISVDVTNDVIFDFTFFDKHYLILLGLDSNFKLFVEHYIFDRVLLNNLECTDSNDQIVVSTNGDNSCIFKLQTEKKYIINYDKY